MKCKIFEQISRRFYNRVFKIQDFWTKFKDILHLYLWNSRFFSNIQAQLGWCAKTILIFNPPRWGVPISEICWKHLCYCVCHWYCPYKPNSTQFNTMIKLYKTLNPYIQNCICWISMGSICLLFRPHRNKEIVHLKHCSICWHVQGPQHILSHFSRFFQGFQGHFMVFFKVPGDEIQGFSRSFRKSN